MTKVPIIAIVKNPFPTMPWRACRVNMSPPPIVPMIRSEHDVLLYQSWYVQGLVSSGEAHLGCDCPPDYEGEHCQFVKGTRRCTQQLAGCCQ